MTKLIDELSDLLDQFRCNKCGQCHELCRCGEYEDEQE